MKSSGINSGQEDGSGEPNLNEQAYRRLRDALIGGVFLPGAKLSIRKVATALGTSAMPARTALRRLAAEQALDILPSGSAVVPRLSREAFGKLAAIRAELEPLAVRMAADNLASLDFVRLTALSDRQLRALADSDPETVLAADRDFLFTIYAACGSSILLQFIGSLWLRRSPLFWDARWMIMSRAGLPHRHAAMIDLLRAGNGAGAAATLREEIETATALLLEQYPFRGPQEGDGLATLAQRP